MPKQKRLKAKQLKHDPFVDWYTKQAERARQHREPIRRTLFALGLVIVLVVGSSLGYSFWKSTAERRLGEAFDMFNAEVTETPPNTGATRTYKTDEEKYRAALEAYKRVSHAWYYKLSDYSKIAKYYEAVCLLHLNPSEGQAALERLAQGSSLTARLAKVALAEHFISKGEPGRAEALYRQLINDPDQLPKPQLQLGLARALELQGKKADAINLYLEVAKERKDEPEKSQAVARLQELDPKALDQLPAESTPSGPKNVLAKYKKK